MKTSVKRCLAVLLSIVVLLASVPLLGAARTETDPYTFVHDTDKIYWFRSPHRYAYKENGVEHYPYVPAMYHVVYDNTSLATYCCDLITSVVEGTAYKRINLEEAAYFSDENAAHIRGILNNGFNETFTDADLSALASKAGVTNLTGAEALSATQLAIWTYANNGVLSQLYYGTRSITSTSDILDITTVNVKEGNKSSTTKITKVNTNIMGVYNYLIKQTDSKPESVVWSFGDATVLTVAENGKYDVTVRFGIEGTDDEVDIVLYADLLEGSDTVASESLAFNSSSKPEKDENGYYTVTFNDVAASDLDGNTSVKLSFSGTQKLKKDVYFYDPEGGRNTAQSFVGIGAGETPVSDTLTATVNVGTQSLSVFACDVDAAGGAENSPMKGLEFALYVSFDGEEPVPYPGIGNKTTDSDGNVSWDGLVKADGVKYYYKQITDAPGYIAPDGGLKEFAADGTAKAENSREYADLTVGNSITGEDVHFDYTVELDFAAADISSNDFSWFDFAAEYADAGVEYSNACSDAQTHPAKVKFNETESGKIVASVSLANGESITFKNLPVGTTFKVTETDNAGHDMQDGEITSVSDKLYSCDDAVISGRVSADSVANAQFVNKQYESASVDVAGTVNLDGAPSNVKFSFSLTDITNRETPSDAVVAENSEGGAISFGAVNFNQPGTYKLEVKQTGSPAGYITDDSVYTVTVEVTKDEDASALAAEITGIEKSGTSEQVNAIVFDNYSSNESLSVKIDWILDDGAEKPASVSVVLLKDGNEAETVELSEENGWQHIWNGLRNDSAWSVKEITAPEGFTSSMTGSGAEFVITCDDIATEPDTTVPDTTVEETTDTPAETTTTVTVPSTTQEETTEKVTASVPETSETEKDNGKEEETSDKKETTTKKATTTKKTTTTQKAVTTKKVTTTKKTENTAKTTTAKNNASSKVTTTKKTATSSADKATTASGANSGAETIIPDTGSEASVITVITFVAIAAMFVFVVTRKRKAIK